jgi:hypothetical protein
LEARAGFASSVSIEQFFVNLDKLGVSSDKFEAGLNFKYADKTTLSQSQKDAVKTISEIAVETLKTKPKDALSDDTGRSIMQFICSGIQKVEVQAPQTIQFGKDDRQVSTSVRPIVFNMKPDAQTIFTNGLPDLIEKILKDNKFRDFVKNQYPKVQKLGDSLKSLFSDNANFAVETQKEYYDRVDKAFDSFKKDEYKKTLQDSENSINKNILVTNAKLTYFVSMSSGSFYGYRSEQTVTYTSKYMEGLKSEEKDVLKDGLISKFESFDQYYGDDVKEVVVPDKVR